MLLVVFGLSFTEIFKAQSKVGIEFGSNINYNLYKANFNGFPGYDCCGNFTNGGGIGINLSFSGLYKKILSTNYFNLNYFTNLSFRNLSGKFEYDEYFADVIIDEKVYKAISHHTLETEVYTFSISPGIEISDIFGLNPISLRFGTSLSIPLKTRFHQKEQLVSPEMAFFENNSKERNVFSDKINNFKSPLFSIDVEFAWKFKINTNFFVKPNLFIDLPLNNFVKGISWKSYQLGIGLAVGYNIPQPRPKPPLPPPEWDFPEPIKPKEFLPLQVELIVEEKGKTFKNFDTLIIPREINNYIELKPIPSIIFYKRNDFLFGEDSIPTSLDYISYYETNKKVLSAVVKHLKENPEEKITLICTQTNDEIPNICDLRTTRLLEFFRAQGLEQKIVDIKKIISTPKKQIPELLDEQRNIQILFRSKTNVVDIALISKVDTSLFFPSLQVKTIVNSVQNHKITTTVETSVKTFNFEVPSFSFSLNNSIISEKNIREIITFKTRVETIEDLPQTQEDSVKILVKIEDTTKNINLLYNPFNGDNYILVALFDFDKSEPYWINPKVNEIVTKFKKEGKKVEIVGSVDNIGSEEHNQKLALSRAQSINNKFKLGLPTKVLEAQKRITNQTPTDRILNRSAWLRFE